MPMPESSPHALAVVSTSLHLLYLAEFAHRYRIASLELVILLKRSTDRAQIEQVLDEIECAEVHWVDATGRCASRFISVYEVFGIGDLSLARSCYTYGVFADYGRSLLANVDCERYYWLGDGTKIIYETSAVGAASVNRHRLQSYADPVVRMLSRKRLLLKHEPQVFSPFALGVPGQELNNFDWLREHYRSAGVGTGGAANMADVAYFFGSYFSERGGRVLMTDDDYLAYMQRVVDYYAARGLELVYVPHRHEGDEKLARIAALPGTRVERFTYPAELEFCKRKERPAHVSSFFSTCLIHFQLLGLSDSVTAFYIDFARHDAGYRPVAEEIYAVIRQTLGEDMVIDLDEQMRRVA
ncbi:MAG: hypothetical protein HKN19_19900 [Halioglobus sp.]|nr:hypothetical protein [Halioglobus sp.]